LAIEQSTLIPTGLRISFLPCSRPTKVTVTVGQDIGIAYRLFFCPETLHTVQHQYRADSTPLFHDKILHFILWLLGERGASFKGQHACRCVRWSTRHLPFSGLRAKRSQERKESFRAKRSPLDGMHALQGNPLGSVMPGAHRQAAGQ
jgi:hypothetical protein